MVIEISTFDFKNGYYIVIREFKAELIFSIIIKRMSLATEVTSGEFIV